MPYLHNGIQEMENQPDNVQPAASTIPGRRTWIWVIASRGFIVSMLLTLPEVLLLWALVVLAMGGVIGAAIKFKKEKPKALIFGCKAIIYGIGVMISYSQISTAEQFKAELPGKIEAFKQLTGSYPEKLVPTVVPKLPSSPQYIYARKGDTFDLIARTYASHCWYQHEQPSWTCSAW
jgi:hypothetical protein